MSLPAPRWISPQEYLDFEALAATKHEYMDGVVYPLGDPDHPLDWPVIAGRRPEALSAMAGGTRRHSSIAVNLVAAIRPLLRGGPCRLYNSDLRLRPAEDAFYYPDLVIVCTDQHGDDTNIEVDNPTIVIEVLSRSTEGLDRGEKFRHYRRASSLQEYVLVSTRQQAVDVYRRDGDRWVLQSYEAGQTVSFESINLELDCAIIYEDIDWDSSTLSTER